MGNTITTATGQFCIEITAIDSDWDAGREYKVSSISFDPATSDEYVVFKCGAATGPRAAYLETADGTPDRKYFNGGPLSLFLDVSDCSVNAGSKITIHVLDMVT